MKLKRHLCIYVAVLLMMTPFLANSHDGGHGPKLTDVGFFGGIVTAVVKKSEQSLGAKASLVYKAELVRSNDGQVRIYIYDSKMKLLKLDDFTHKAEAVLISFDNGKENLSEFSLKIKKKNFIGQLPKAKSKPYNVDVIFEQKGVKYLAAFDHLD